MLHTPLKPWRNKATPAETTVGQSGANSRENSITTVGKHRHKKHNKTVQKTSLTRRGSDWLWFRVRLRLLILKPWINMRSPEQIQSKHQYFDTGSYVVGWVGAFTPSPRMQLPSILAVAGCSGGSSNTTRCAQIRNEGGHVRKNPKPQQGLF